MIQLQRKLIRVQRLREIDQSQMSAFAIQLAHAQTNVQRALATIQQTQMQFEANLSQPIESSLASRNQSMVFADHLHRQLDLQRSSLSDAEKIRDTCMRQVVEQKSKIQGWDSLITKLQQELASEQQKVESARADDRHLSKLAGRNS